MQNNQLFRKIIQNTLLLVVLLHCFFITKTDAQNWPWIMPISGAGNQTITGITTQPNTGIILTAGHFKNELTIDNSTEPAVGITDLFLAATNPDGVPLWVQTGHGLGANLSADVATDDQGQIYWAGTYWFTTDFGALSLTATKGAKALFLLKMDANGNPIWGQSIDGTGNKLLSAMIVDAAGNTYVTGNFSDSLFIENIVLTATAEKDFFIIKFAPDGNVLWTRQSGINGEIIPARMVYENNRIAVTGSMRGQYDFESDTIENNTNDSDAFVVVYDPDGAVEWARKIGGVNEQSGSDVAFDGAGNVYAVGSFFGLVRLRENLEIQTQNLNENFYLVKYNGVGDPLAARSIGGLELELSQALRIVNDRLYWCGYFRDGFTVDGFTLTADGTNFNSFVLELNTDLVVQAVYPVTSEAVVLLTELTALPTGELFVGGSLNGTADFEGTFLSTTDGYDSFVGKLNTTLTDTKMPLSAGINIYPNPAQDWVRLETEEVIATRVYTVTGTLILETMDKEIDCSEWRSGVYYFLIKTVDGAERIMRLIKS